MTLQSVTCLSQHVVFGPFRQYEETSITRVEIIGDSWSNPRDQYIT